MIKKQHKKSTQSSRRHAFSSFRERVDAIKIQPSLNLARRVYDYTDESHFISTLEHWNEVNLSGNFSEFVLEIASVSNSLPQLLHHKTKIFNALHHHIELNDIHSQQPLLELLSQFIHDLGPDFLEFYPETLRLLTALALATNPSDIQNNANTSNALEWLFNCLTFIFKYLYRYLVDDFTTTLDVLLPILTLDKKTYISRFCAEALSFLVKKMKSPQLSTTISHLLIDNLQTLEENQTYREALIIIFSESIKSTNSVFTSKASTIYSQLLTTSLSELKTNIIISGILAEIFNHGSVETVKPFTEITLAKITSALETCDATSLVYMVELIASLAFAESGKKIGDWAPVFATVNTLLDTLKHSPVDTKTADAVSYSLTILIRNSDAINLAKNFKHIVGFISTFNEGVHFIPFVAASHEICNAKVSALNINNFLQEFINNKTNDHILKQLSLLLSSSDHFSGSVFIPPHVQQLVIESINEKTAFDDLEDLFWKLNLLSPLKIDVSTHIVSLIGTLLELHNHTLFFSDLLGSALAIVANTHEDIHETVLSRIIPHFKDLQQSSTFILAFTNVVKRATVSEDMASNIIALCAENLKLDDNKCRLATIELVINLYTKLQQEPPQIFSQMRLVEQVPLTLANGRDLKLRIKNLILTYNQESTKTELHSMALVNFLFGMLTNKFQPCWEGVFENIALIKASCEPFIWELVHHFMILNYDEQNSVYSDHPIMMLDDDSVELNFVDGRMKNSFSELERKYYTTFRSVPHSIIDHAQAESTNLVYSSLLRSHVIQVLHAVPDIAERHNQDLLSLVLSDEGSNTDWTTKDRNALLSVFSKFKNLKSMKNSDKFYEKLLIILGSKRVQAQKLALDVIINFKNPSIQKYKDNLKNLTDDTLFRDELTTFLTNDNDSKIEESDLKVLVPLILRILFGRAQGAPASNSKSGQKNAVLGVLPSFKEDQIAEFLDLGSKKIGFESFGHLNSNNIEENFKYLRRMNGYVSLLTEIYDSLGYKFKTALSRTIEPLVYSLAVAQARVGAESEASETSDIEIKTAKNIRQIGMKCLNVLFSLLGDTYDWTPYMDPIYLFVLKPRMENFAAENLQQASSLMKLMTGWIKMPNVAKFLLVDDIRPARSIIDLLANRKAKDAVVAVALAFSADCLRTALEDEAYYTLLAILVESLLNHLPDIIEQATDSDIISKAVTILLLLIDGEYIDNEETRTSLLSALASAMDKPVNKVPIAERAKMLISLSSLVSDYEGTFESFLPYYRKFSKCFKEFDDRRLRIELVGLFNSFGAKFLEVSEVADLLEGLNSYANERLGEPDFERRIVTYKKINDELYRSLTPLQWLPILNCALFFINDEEELVVRSNASYILNHFVKGFSEKEDEETAKPYVHLLKELILPNIRPGLRSKQDVVQAEYVSVLGYIVQNSKYFNELDDMKVLLFRDDDEANFFTNICHIQLHRRQRAIKRASEHRNELSSNSISHFIVPIIESYAFNTDEKLRNVALEASASIGLLVRCVSWNQYKAILRRYIARARVAKEDTLKIAVSLVVSVSKALFYAISSRDKSQGEDQMKELPNQENTDQVILQDFVPVISKILDTRNDETIVDRVQLSEALVGLIRCLSGNLVEEQLPGLLTSTCQVLRSRSEELRDAARKSLCHIARDLGAKFIRFLIKELKGALTRGSQIHVLSFTMHSLLIAVQDSIEHGDLNDACSLIVEIIMEDTFGAAGQEKDAEGYTSKMKEVKHKKSFDSGEILTGNISLDHFARILNPVRLVLQERISLKVQNRLDELLRRYALGLNHNEESTSRNILILSYQINKQAVEVFTSEENKGKEIVINDSEDHFLVKLDARPMKTQVDYTQYMHTLQKFSFELLRSAISRHENLMTVANMQEFVPLLETGVNSDHEGLVATSYRLLHTIVRLPFSEETNGIFKACARKALNIIKDSPSTNTEICQASLKYLATLIRHKPEITLKHTAISYVLVRIQPDLEEPHRQGLAFNFLKSIVSQHILLPEVYDVMESVSKIMVVNHNREIRDMARSVYFQFLMEYDQSRGKLEKQFKFLVNNLEYATAEGRASVLELIHLVVNKAGEDLLNRLASSFFVALANMLINDDSSRCREMAAAVIANILKKLKNRDNIEKYISAWISANDNEPLLRCGLSLYKLYIGQFGLQHEELNKITLDKLEKVFQQAANHEEGEDVEWQLVYQTLTVFSAICSAEKVHIMDESYEVSWKSIFNMLLFPHSWVRLSASRLIGVFLTNLDQAKFEVTGYEVQTIAYRLLRQLSAPSITEDLADQVTKNLVLIAMRWEKSQKEFEEPDSTEGDLKYKYSNQFLVHRAANIIRQEARDTVNSKKAAIKLCAMLVQVLSGSLLDTSAQEILLSLFNYTESGDSSDELVTLASECSQIIEAKVGGTKYTELYSRVQKIVNSRRQQRKTKRAQLAVTAPDLAAKRKMKKHARSREKRKHEKDENGYYRKKGKHS